MVSRRFYSNSASTGTITASLNNTDITSAITLSTGAPTSWPGQPCTAAISLGKSDEEVVLVTAISGATMTITRGYNGSAIRAHSAQSTIDHVAVALDYDEANSHTTSSTGVHGIFGSVVGTSDTQTLSNKALTAPAVSDFTNAPHDHSSTAHGGSIALSAVTGLATEFATKADDINTVHNTGTETVQGAKTFSAATAVSGALTVSGAASFTSTTALGSTTIAGPVNLTKNTGNNIPQVLDGSGNTTSSAYIYATSGAYTITATNEVLVTFNYSGCGFTSILSAQVTPSANSLNRIDANFNGQPSTTSASVNVRSSENVAINATGVVYLTIFGTV